MEDEKLDLTIGNAYKTLNKYLKEKHLDKYEHSIRVAKICKILAQKWNANVEDAIIAGLLHDIGKCLSKQEMLNLCAQNKITMYDFEVLETLSALHGKASSLLFQKEFKNTPTEKFQAISHAIICHVAGSTEKLNLLDKILFIADNIDPHKKCRMLSQILTDPITDLNQCIKELIEDKKQRAKLKDRELNPLLEATLDTLKEER